MSDPVDRLNKALAGFAVLAMSVAVASCSAPPEQVALSWKYEEGSQLVYRVITSTESVLPRGQGTTVTTQTQTRRLTVQSVAVNGDATIAVTIGDVPEPDFSMVVGADGRVKSIEGMEQLFGAPPSDAPPEAQAMMAAMFNEELMTSLAQQNLQILPRDTVGPDDSWQDSVSVMLVMGPVNTNVTFLLDGIERRDGRTVALVSSTGEVPSELSGALGDALGAMGDALSDAPGTADGPEALGDAMGVMVGVMEMMDIDVETMTGTYTFDVDRGVTLTSTTTTAMTMTMPAAGQPMITQMTMTVSLELMEYVPGG